MDRPAPPEPGEPPRALLPAARGGPLLALWHLLQPVLAMLLLLALVGGALGGAALWLLRSPEGTAWLLARLPGMQVSGTQGALLSDAFAAERVVVRWDNGEQSVTIDGLRGSALRWSWHPAPGAWFGLEAGRLQARRVDVQTGPPGPRPIQMPRTLQLPLRLQAAQVDIDELQIDALSPMTAVHGQRVRLWDPGDRGYQADAVALNFERAHVEGRVSMGAVPPFTLQAEARLTSLPGPAAAAWAAQARASGPLARFRLQATLRGQARSPGASPALDAEVDITPLESWALGQLRLRTRALDLATLLVNAPRTALSGRMEIDSRSRTGPLAAAVELDNAQPGRWDQGRLPLRRLQARVRSPDRDRGRLVIDAFDVQFAGAAEDAGRWRGSGLWNADRLQIDSTLDALRPSLLDARAAVMTLSGPLAFALGGLPSPDPAAAPPARKPDATLDLRSTLDGRIEGSPHAVRLSVDGSADARRIEVRELIAEAGSARAVLAANARRGNGQGWQVRSSGTVTDFDPLPWWPGAEKSAWRSGTHRISGSWAVDLTLPKVLTGLAPLTLAQGVSGSGTLNVTRAQLAGVPLSLQLELGNRPEQAESPGSLRGQLVVAGNRLTLDARGNPLGDGRADRMHLALQADRLAALAPVAQLLPELDPWAPRAGAVEAALTVQGRWPDVRSEGRAVVQDLRTGALAAQRVQANWRFDTASDRPLLLQLEARGLQQDAQRLEQLRLDLRGTLRDHRLELAAALPAGPPPALALALGLRTAAGTQATLRADGQWTADGGGGGRWSGQIERISLGSWSGQLTPAAGGAGSVWADARSVAAEVHFDASGGLTGWQASAGQLRLADAATLRWDEVRVDLRGRTPAFTLRAGVEPVALAPLLARAQPEMGWSGDLRVAARVDIRAADAFDADIALERHDGDLALAEGGITQPFGLSDVRLVASAHDGLWQIAGAFAGRTLGEAAARLNLRTRADQRWPSTDTPIDGVIEGRVANLGVWSSWVPPGWRLSGELRTSATVGGRIDAPDYAGQVSADRVAVRNLLLGVDIRDGQARVRLAGANAEIERFTLRGGDGALRVTGRARLDERPGFAVQVVGERFRALGRIDRQLIASGALDVALEDGVLRAEGKVRVDDGLFDLSRGDAPTLDDDVRIRQARRGDAPAAAAAQRPRRAHRVAIDIDLGERLQVRGRGLDTTLSGHLRLGTSQGRPLVSGIVNAAGTYAAYGQKLSIERGSVIFQGDAENPTLDVLALRPDLDIQVGVAIVGPVQTPRVRLYASTDMSESDKLSWLVLGRPSEGLGRADSALLQRAAVALLAGEGEAPTDKLLRNLGIDQLSLRQSDTDVRETVVSLGKHLSRRWYVGYERGVNATAGTWQLIYRVAQRFTLRAQSGLENSLDLIWVWRLDDPPLPDADGPMPKSSAATPP